jgi:hypothetical protein
MRIRAAQSGFAFEQPTSGAIVTETCAEWRRKGHDVQPSNLVGRMA